LSELTGRYAWQQCSFYVSVTQRKSGCLLNSKSQVRILPEMPIMINNISKTLTKEERKKELTKQRLKIVRTDKKTLSLMYA
jgi:hypothetical protein